MEVTFAQVCDDGVLHPGQTHTVDGLHSLPDACKALLHGPVTVALASRNPNGSVHMSPVWLGRDNTHLYLTLFRGHPNDVNVRARPDVTLLLVDPAEPCLRMTVTGVVDHRLEEDDEGHDVWVGEFMNELEPKVELRVGGSECGGSRTLYRIRPQKVLLYRR